MSCLFPYLTALESKVSAENWFASLSVSWQECEKYHYLYVKIEEVELQNSIQRTV